MASFASGDITFGNNAVRYSGDYTRTGTKITINLSITPKWALQSQQTGWVFGIYCGSTTLKSATFAYWSCGDYSNPFGTTKELFASATYELGTTDAVTIKVGCNSMLYNDVTYSNITYSFTVPASLLPPSAPTWCSASGRYEIGESVSISWGGASGTISSYDVEYNQYDTVDGWKGWGTAVGTISGTTMSQPFASVGNNRAFVKYRVRAKNSAGVSAWSPESGYVYHYGVKVNQNGFRWSTVKVWNGSSWQHARIKVWDGSAWIGAK